MKGSMSRIQRNWLVGGLLLLAFLIVVASASAKGSFGGGGGGSRVSSPAPSSRPSSPAPAPAPRPSTPAPRPTPRPSTGGARPRPGIRPRPRPGVRRPVRRIRPGGRRMAPPGVYGNHPVAVVPASQLDKCQKKKSGVKVWLVALIALITLFIGVFLGYAVRS